MIRTFSRAAIALAGVLLLSMCTLAWAGAGDKKLDIYWVDVEGGAATLIVTPTGESILIDSGNPGRRDPEGPLPYRPRGLLVPEGPPAGRGRA